jgi:hypothetical protein
VKGKLLSEGNEKYGLPLHSDKNHGKDHHSRESGNPEKH